MTKKNLFLKLLTTVFFLISTALLTATCFYVRPGVLKKIKITGEKNLRQSLAAVLPRFDNEPWSENFKISGVEIYPARREEKVSLPADPSGPVEFQTVTANVLKGFAFQVPAADGEGQNPVWIGLDLEGEVTGFRPSYLRPARVPENFSESMSSRTPASRAMTDAVKRGKEFFETHRNFFFAQAHADAAQPAGETP